MLRKLTLYLIKPSHYDDDGYVVRHWRGILPSNTLACLAGLTEYVVSQKRLGDSLKVNIHVLDETVDRIPVNHICRSQRGPHMKTIVCLVGVQTNQFPRAADLARTFRRAGLTVMIGGFHVSGYLALLPEIPPDIQELMDEGVTLVKGEVEETWGDLLCDAVNDRLKPLYDFIDQKPDLYEKPIPTIQKKYLRKFVDSNFGTLDCGRGCPFECSFCTIINVQGRKMRFRSAECIAEAVRRNYREHGISFYFFTDDNFARNKNWEAIFDVLILLREQEKVPVEFMMQVDVLSWKINGFVAKARRAGCINVFIGMESINAVNLRAAGKNQNHVNEYSELIETYRTNEISTHVGYIIGFPSDTIESVRCDVAYLMQEVRPDHASFFMLMPLPGSQDHLVLFQRKTWMDPDFNRYDSHHAVCKHPNMTADEWKALYLDSWRTFYGLENMKAVLRRTPACNYWNNFIRFAWYKNSILTEERHPMMCGFLRLKGRKNVRPGYPTLSRRKYYANRVREIYHHFKSMMCILLEMEELWLQTRNPREAEQRVLEELRKMRTAYGHIKVADLQTAFLRAKNHFPALHIPSKLELFWAKWSPLLAPSKVYTRADLDLFWQSVHKKWVDRSWFQIPLHRVAGNLFRDAQLSLLFFLQFIRTR